MTILTDGSVYLEKGVTSDEDTIGNADTTSLAAIFLKLAPALLHAVARKSLKRKERGSIPSTSGLVLISSSISPLRDRISRGTSFSPSFPFAFFEAGSLSWAQRHLRTMRMRCGGKFSEEHHNTLVCFELSRFKESSLSGFLISHRTIKLTKNSNLGVPYLMNSTHASGESTGFGSL